MRTPVNADLSHSSRGLCGAGAQPPARPEGAPAAFGKAGGGCQACRQNGGPLTISPLFSGGPRPGLPTEVLCVSPSLGCRRLQQVQSSGVGLGVEVEGVFWMRLCCFAMLIWGGKKKNPAALFTCLSLSLLPPRPPDGGLSL